MNYQRWRFCHVSSGVPLQWPLLDAGFTQPYIFYLSMVIFLDFYGFNVTLRTSVRFEAWKLKSNKKTLLTPFLQKSKYNCRAN